MSPAAIALPQTPPSPSAESFPEALFRSTLGGSSRQSIPTSAPPPYVSRTTVGPPLGALLAQQKLLSEQHDDDEPPLPLHTLERQLYLHSCTSLLLTLAYFLTPYLPFSLARFAPPSPLLALTAYTSLLLTFRVGVRRIALSTFEVQAGGVALNGAEEEGLPLVDEEEHAGPGKLEGPKSVLVQSLTLWSAAALMHLPVHSFNDLPLGIGFAAWCCSASLVGLIMWDVVNRAFVASTEPVDEEEGAGLSWADGYIIKA